MTETDKQDQAAPPLASLMGFGGLIPFFVSAGAAHSGVAPWNALAVMACGVYGSVILSFVGAVHWAGASASREDLSSRWGVLRSKLSSAKAAADRL